MGGINGLNRNNRLANWQTLAGVKDTWMLDEPHARGAEKSGRYCV